MSQYLRYAACLSVLLLAWSMPQAQTSSQAEKRKIEALIRRVSELKDAKFVRNGKEYDAATAARFLRGKWKANDDAVQSARDFVDKIASVSGTSGKAYRIRFNDGREMTSRDFLLDELKKLRS